MRRTTPNKVGAHAARREPRGADPVAPSLTSTAPLRLSPQERKALLAVLEELGPQVRMHGGSLAGGLGRELTDLADRFDRVLAANAGRIARAS